MFATNRYFGAKSVNRISKFSSGRKPGRKPQRRRFGSIENLERREMMAADSSMLRLMPLSSSVSSVMNATALVGPASVAAVVTISDNTIATAQNVGTVQGVRTFSDYVGSSDVTDFYRFVLDEQAEVTLRLDQLSADIDLYLYNSSGQEIARSWLGGNASEQIVRTLAGGTYYARAARYGSAQSNYRLAIDVDVANESIATARNLGTVSGQQTITDWVGTSDTNDYFRFSVNQQSQATLRLDQLAADIDLYLYNSAGQEVARSWLGGTSSEQIQMTLGTGTYYARITPYGSAQSDYRFSLTVNGVSTPNPAGGFQITLSMSGLTTSQQSIFNQAARRWEQVIVGDLPNVTYNGQVIDDLMINASSVSIDGIGNILGQATYDGIRSGNRGLPYHGFMQFDSADIAEMERTGQLFGVVTHEIGHILGVGTLWQSFGLLSGAGTSNPIFVGAQATAAYNQVFGASAAGVPVENGGGPGTRDSHWRESVLRTELMTGYAEPVSMPLSRITVGSLADLGYSVNFAAADAYSRPISIQTSTSASMASTGPALRSGASLMSPVGQGLNSSAAGRSFALGLPPGSVDATISNEIFGSANRIIVPVAAESDGASANASSRSLARTSAFESWNGELSNGALDSAGSASQLQAAFESAWSDLALGLFETAMA